MHINFEKIN